MELRVWIGTVQRIISGVSEKTTSHEVIVALAQATGKTGRFTLVEKWRDYEKALTPNECPILLAQKFGDYAYEVQFILRQTGETTQNRRLAEAKSPKPQRRRAAIKKSMSFSGGAQCVSPSRSPRLRLQDDGIVEEESLSDSNYVTPQPRVMVPQPHPADTTVAMQPTASKTVTETSLDDPPRLDPNERRTRQSSSSSVQSKHRQDRPRKSKSGERSADKSHSRSEARRQREAEMRHSELVELQQTIANHERRLEDEKRKLHNIDRDISAVTIEEELKWGRLYDCRDDISKALVTVQQLEVELDDCDEVLLSEEINVLLLRQQEMSDEMADIQRHIDDYELHLNKGRDEMRLFVEQLEDINVDNEHLDSAIRENEEEMSKYQKRVGEKKRFLLEAEDGYMSACDDLKEADNSLEKRKQMLVEIERDLREYNLKTFINTGFNEKYNGDLQGRVSNKLRGLLV